MKMVYKNIPMEVADIDESQGIIKGYGSIFGNKDADGDIITQGAYSKTIKENGERVRYCWQHDIKQPIAKFLELGEDETGVPFVAQFAMKSASSRDKFELIKSGVVDENSVGIGIVTKDPQKDANYIREVKLYEISAVTLAANDLARTMGAKGLTKEEMLDVVSKKFDALTKFIRKGNITDETGYAIEGELLALKTLTQETFTKPSVSDTLPKKEEMSEDEVVKSIIKFL